MTNNPVNLENIWGKIGAVSRDEIRLAVLKDEVAVFQSRIEPHDTGHLYTTIGTLLHRIDELEGRKPVSRSVEELREENPNVDN